MVAVGYRITRVRTLLPIVLYKVCNGSVMLCSTILCLVAIVQLAGATLGQLNCALHWLRPSSCDPSSEL